MDRSGIVWDEGRLGIVAGGVGEVGEFVLFCLVFGFAGALGIRFNPNVIAVFVVTPVASDTEGAAGAGVVAARYEAL